MVNECSPWLGVEVARGVCTFSSSNSASWQYESLDEGTSVGKKCTVKIMPNYQLLFIRLLLYANNEEYFRDMKDFCWQYVTAILDSEFLFLGVFVFEFEMRSSAGLDFL